MSWPKLARREDAEKRGWPNQIPHKITTSSLTGSTRQLDLPDGYSRGQARHRTGSAIHHPASKESDKDWVRLSRANGTVMTSDLSF
jgi:hypothetical protein